MNPRPARILFLCTHNRCRSILAEALTRHQGANYLIAASAGSSPEGQVHPDTLTNLRQRGVNIDGLHSKSWHEMAEFAPDYAVAVCQQAAGEACPTWMNNVPMVHWGLPDPSKITQSATERQQAFADVMDTIEKKIAIWVGLLQADSSGLRFREAMDSQLARRSTQSRN
ncbi:MAG: arsenate reductase ArsC [Ketobacter sp.]|nr:arsenate reductase ArsC [Ketobacter sp.]